MPVNDDPGDAEEEEGDPPPVRAPDAYKNHQAQSQQVFICLVSYFCTQTQKKDHVLHPRHF